MKKRCLVLPSVFAVGAISAVVAGEDGSDTLSYSYESLDNVPEQFRSLYSEGENGFVLTGIAGIKTEQDVSRVMGSLEKERKDHKQTRAELSRLGRPIDEVLAELDRIPALEAAANGSGNIDEQIKGRLQQETAPLQRTIQQLEADKGALAEQLQQLQHQNLMADISSNTAKFANKHKVLPDAVEDVQFMAQSFFEKNDNGDLVAKPNINGVTAGTSIEAWLIDLKQTKPYLFPSSNVPNMSSKTGKGVMNPWAKDTFNMTEQSRIMKENPTLGAQLKASAGVK